MGVPPVIMHIWMELFIINPAFWGFHLDRLVSSLGQVFSQHGTSQHFVLKNHQAVLGELCQFNCYTELRWEQNTNTHTHTHTFLVQILGQNMWKSKTFLSPYKAQSGSSKKDRHPKGFCVGHDSSTHEFHFIIPGSPMLANVPAVIQRILPFSKWLSKGFPMVIPPKRLSTSSGHGCEVPWNPSISHWLVVWTPLKNMKVNWDDEILNIWENKTCSKPPTSHATNRWKKDGWRTPPCGVSGAADFRRSIWAEGSSMSAISGIWSAKTCKVVPQFGIAKLVNIIYIYYYYVYGTMVGEY